MRSPIFSLKGSVSICFRCEKPERFLNLCARGQIPVTGLRETVRGYECRIPAGQFKNLKKICRKTGARVRITGKYGLPFFFCRNRKRKAFFIGIFLALALIGFLSTRIWNIHIEGNQRNSTQMILRFLEEKDIRHGIARSAVNCAQIAAWIRGAYPDVTWVSARLEGTSLRITLEENPLADTGQETELPCDLVAEKDGTIVRMVTRQGIPAVGAGTTVRKGDLLVSGQIPIQNDAGETVRYDYVHADADVWISYRVSYRKSFSLKYSERVYTGETKERYFFQILDRRLSLGLPDDTFARQDTVSEFHTFYLTENFALPVWWGRSTQREYRLRTAAMSREEAVEQARRDLERDLEDLLEQGIRICENQVKTELTDTECVTQGYLTLLQNADTESLIRDFPQPEQPAEETES